MKLRYLFALLFFVIAMGFYSCERDDDEPPINNSISRLYISYSDFNQNEGSGVIKFNNVVLLPFSDSSQFDLGANPFLSKPKGGGSIYFNPSARIIFHGSQNSTLTDTFIYKLSVGPTGALNVDDSRIRQSLLKVVRGMVFHPSMDKLYALDVKDDSSRYFVFDRPRGLNSFQKPAQHFYFQNRIDPWEIAIVNSSIIVSKSANESGGAGVEIYDNLIIPRDSIVPNTNPSKVLTVANATNIRGMSVDTVNNMLALTDFVENGTTSEGRILIFDDFKAISQASGTITPTRIITGPSTLLKQPIDVELDFRKDSKYLYVADPKSQAVYRFLKSANGNVAPNAVYQYKQAGRSVFSTPAGISLDARN